MEIIEKLIFEAKTNFALSLQQLMQLDENCIELINKKDELYSIITKYNNYFFARYNEYILLRTSSEDGKFIKEVETFNNTLFNTALSSSGDGEEGFYPDPQNNQKINISTNKYFPMFSIENVIDLPENSVFILLETFLNNYISELNSLYFGELEERTYYPGAEEDDPLNSWDNFTTVKENILDLFDALETNFNNIWTQINNAYNLIPSEYSTFLDFLSKSNYDQNWGLQYIVTEGDTWQYWTSAQTLVSESITFPANTLVHRYFTLLKPCMIDAILSTTTNLDTTSFGVVANANVYGSISNHYNTPYYFNALPGRMQVFCRYTATKTATLTLNLCQVNNYNYQGTFTPAHFIYNWSSSA